MPIATESELLAVLRQMNPWWSGQRIPDLPDWRRAAFRELDLWVRRSPAPRAVLLAGARQIGKTTLFLQTIQNLVDDGTPAGNIFYATFDHPLLKLAGVEEVIRLWRAGEPLREGPEYLFLDEVQFLRDWQTWIKLQVDFYKNRRIAFTGSATPLAMEGQESGVGRWHTIRLATLSFYEYLRIRKIEIADLPEVSSLRELFEWPELELARAALAAEPLAAHFHEYLLRGGFPQAALASSLTWAQKLLREDIVDKVLKRDMTALFGVRRVLELEQTFLYLCLHDGGMLDMQDLCKNLQVKKPTASNYISLLESVHLIHRLQPHGYGKEILRGRTKVYLADASIAPSVLYKGKELLEDEHHLGRAVETAFFKHVFTRYYGVSVGFSYWQGKRQGKKGHEVVVIAEAQGRLIPFEVKYRGAETGPADLKGLREFCAAKGIGQGYVITRHPRDLGVLRVQENGAEVELLKLPAPLACYWLG